MELRVFVGRYIKKGKATSDNKELNNEINDVLNKISMHENELDIEEFKLANTKLRRMPIDYFRLMYPFITTALEMSKKDQEKTLRKACKELNIDDIYVDRIAIFKEKKYKLANVFDFSSTICSEMGKYSVKLISSIKDELSSEELKKVLEEIDNNNEQIIEKIKNPYIKWCENLTVSKELSDILKGQENLVLSNTKDMINVMIAREIEREEALYLKGKSNLRDIIEKEKRKTKFYRKWMDE